MTNFFSTNFFLLSTKNIYKKNSILKIFKNISFIKKEININMFRYKLKKKKNFHSNTFSLNYFIKKYFYYLEWINKFKIFTLKNFLKEKKTFFIKNKKKKNLLDVKKKEDIIDILIKKTNSNISTEELTKIWADDLHLETEYLNKKNRLNNKLDNKVNNYLSKNRNKNNSTIIISLWNINNFDFSNIDYPGNMNLLSNPWKDQMTFHGRLKYNQGFFLKDYSFKEISNVISYKKEWYTINYLRSRVSATKIECAHQSFKMSTHYMPTPRYLSITLNNFIYKSWSVFSKNLNLILFLSHLLVSKKNLKEKNKYKLLLYYLMYICKLYENLFVLSENKLFIKTGSKINSYVKECFTFFSNEKNIILEEKLNDKIDVHDNMTLRKIVYHFCLLSKTNTNKLLKRKFSNSFFSLTKNKKKSDKEKTTIDWYIYFRAKKFNFFNISDAVNNMYKEYFKNINLWKYNIISRDLKKLSKGKSFLRKFIGWWAKKHHDMNMFFFNAEESILFSLFFVTPLKLDKIDFYNKKEVDKHLKYKNEVTEKHSLFKYKKKLFINIKDHFLLYNYLKKFLKKKNLNSFYINDNFSMYISYLNSYYKRHLVHKFKFKKNNNFLKYNCKYNYIRLSNKTNKNILKWKNIYNKLYERKYDLSIGFRNKKSNEIKKWHIIIKKSKHYKHYYKYKTRRDVLKNYKEFNIRHYFKNIYISYFFKWFKKKIFFHIFSNLFNYFFSIKKERILIKKKLTLSLNTNSIGIIIYRNTLKNLFLTLTNQNGKQLFSASSGSFKFIGYKKALSSTINNVTKSFFLSIEKILHKNGINKLKFIVKGYLLNFHNIVYEFVNRFTHYDKLTLLFFNYISFLKKYMLYIKKQIQTNKHLFLLNMNRYFSIINSGYHFLNYTDIKRFYYPYKFTRFKILFIKIKSNKYFH